MEKRTQFTVNDGHRVPVANSVVLNSQLTLDVNNSLWIYLSKSLLKEVERFLNGLLELGAHHNHSHMNGASPSEKKPQE